MVDEVNAIRYMESRSSEAFCFSRAEWHISNPLARQADISNAIGVYRLLQANIDKMSNRTYLYKLEFAKSLSFVSNLCSVHSCVAYLRLRRSARSARTLWTSLRAKQLLTVLSLAHSL